MTHAFRLPAFACKFLGMALLIASAMPAVKAQQTVGLFSYSAGSFEGYTLLAPQASFNTYLIDNCGREVHRWTSNFQPGNSVRLQEDGLLLRCRRVPNGNFPAGGSGGGVERLDWNGNVVWSYAHTGATQQQHHDATTLPNGNVLILAWHKKTAAEAIAAGREPAGVTNSIWTERILEIQPSGLSGGTIVWQWDLWDHLVQDFDSSQANFGVVADHPELVNINHYDHTPGPVGFADWVHANAVAYDPIHDQVVISSRHLSEFWVIDHSTTTAEASGHTGGSQGKGGDILYRWGNPQVYQRGDSSDRQLFGQHNVHWIPQGLPNAGKFILFNNGTGRPTGYSSLEIISSPVDSSGAYPISPGQAFGPAASDWTWTANPPTSFYSNSVSGAQQLPNGNVLACEGIVGRLLEVDTAGQVLWEYVNPVQGTGPVNQGSPTANNMLFVANRYAPPYPGLAGHVLTPGDRIEGNPLPLPPNCLGTALASAHLEGLQAFPNPGSGALKLHWNGPAPARLHVRDACGRLIHAQALSQETTTLDTEDWADGLYLLQIEGQSGSLRWLKQ